MPRESISLVRRGTLIYSASVHLAMAIHRCMDDTVDLTDLSEQAQYAVKQALADRPCARIETLTQADIRRVPGVGSNTMSEIRGWAARHRIHLPRW